MKTLLFATLSLLSVLLTAACDVTGTAPPDSVYGQQGDGMNQIGQPGYGSP